MLILNKCVTFAIEKVKIKYKFKKPTYYNEKTVCYSLIRCD